MKKLLAVFALVCLCLWGVFVFGDDQKQTELSGWVSDSHCGAEHIKPGGKDCVEKCIRGGASVGHPEWKPQARVFVDEADKKVWNVTNQDSLKGYEGDHVKIQAHVLTDPADSIEVVDVAK